MERLTKEEAQEQYNELMNEIKTSAWNRKLKVDQDKDMERLTALQVIIVRAEKDEQAIEQEEKNLERIENGKPEYFLTQEEAISWRDKILHNPQHAYWNDKATIREHELAVAFVNRLNVIVANKDGGTIEGYISDLEKEHEEERKIQYGSGIDEDKHGAYDGEKSEDAFGEEGEEA